MIDFQGTGHEVTSRAADIDWSKMSYEDAVKLGVTLGMVRDTRANHAIIKAADSSHTSTFVAIALMSTLFVLLGIETAVVLCLVFVFMLVRAAVFTWKERRVRNELAIVEELTCDVIDELASKYPQSQP